MNMAAMAMPLMPGMLTPEQMEALAKASGAAFDHLFLTGMIQHHTGALIMVEDLFDTPGAGQDAVLVRLCHRHRQHPERRNQHHARHAEGEKMITKRSPECSRGAVALAFAVSLVFPALAAAQNTPAPTAPPPPTVYSNPRAGSDDPRIGLEARPVRCRRRRPPDCERLPPCRSRPASRRAMTPPPTPPLLRHHHRRLPGPRRGRAAPGSSIRLHQLRPGLQRQPPVRRQLQRHQFLRHRQPGARSSCGLRWSVPADRATSPSTATCCSCRPKP